MSRDKIEGTYTNVKDEKFVKYAIEAGNFVYISGFLCFPKSKQTFYPGCPADMAKQLLGTHWRMTLSYDGDNRIVTHVTCEEMPAMNMLDTYVEGQVKTVDHPLFGGKGTVIQLRPYSFPQVSLVGLSLQHCLKSHVYFLLP